MDDGYDLLAVRIRRGTTINGAIVALCPDAAGNRHRRRVHRRPAGPVTRGPSPQYRYEHYDPR